jgi:transposase
MGHTAKTVDISKATVQAVIERIKKTGTPIPKPSPGHAKRLNERDLRRLTAIARSNPFASYDQINSLINDHQIDICRATLIHYLKNLGFGSYSHKQ